MEENGYSQHPRGVSDPGNQRGSLTAHPPALTSVVHVPGTRQAARIPWWAKLDMVLALEVLIVFGERQKTVATYSISSNYQGQGGSLRDNIKDETEPAVGPGKGHSTCEAGGGRSQLCSRNWR